MRINFSILLFLLLTFSACKDDFNVDYPSSYSFSGSELVKYETYQIQDGAFVKIDNDDATSADLFDDYLNSASFNTLVFESENDVRYDDGWGESTKSYEVADEQLSFTIDGQVVSFEIVDEGSRLRVRSIQGGEFGNGNLTAGSYCGNFVDCDQINGNEWLFVDSFTPEGHIQYIVVSEETYDLQ